MTKGIREQKLDPPPRFDEVYRQGVRNMAEVRAMLEGRINHIGKIDEPYLPYWPYSPRWPDFTWTSTGTITINHDTCEVSGDTAYNPNVPVTLTNTV